MPRSSDNALLAMRQRMQTLTVLHQGEEAAALDLPLGFSSAAGA
jgi:predicted lipoprotein